MPRAASGGASASLSVTTTADGEKACESPPGSYSVAGLEFGGRDVPAEPFPNGGEYTLLAASTAIQHTSP